MNRTSETEQTIAIIGAGWAGLAAAITLTAAGQHVTIFEAARRPGGRARQIGSSSLDNGQHLLLGAYQSTLALMRKIGLSPEKMLRRLPFTIIQSDGFSLRTAKKNPLFSPLLPEKLRLASAWIGANGLDFHEKWHGARWLFTLLKRNSQIEPDRSVTDWLAETGQTGTLADRLWKPLCLAALNTPAHMASARVFAQILRDSLGSNTPGATDFLLPKNTLSDLLPNPAINWLTKQGARIHCSRRVTRLIPQKNHWQIETKTETQRFSQVILSAAPQHIPLLLRNLPGADAFLAHIPTVFSPIATLYFFYPPKTRLRFPVMPSNSKTATHIGQWFIDRGHGIIAAVLSGHGQWETLAKSELARRLHEEIHTLLDKRTYDGTPITQPESREITEKYATFAALPNLSRCPSNTPWPGLFIAGDHAWINYPATLESAVRSGELAAQLCLKTRNFMN
jgi:squalene-associated FAD-dependent desaturase